VSTDHQVSIVTGASSGIGRAIALALGTLGGTIALVGRDARRLKEVTELVRIRGARAEAYEADLGIDADILRVANAVRNDFGGADVLIHSAGIFRMGSIADAPLADIDLLYRTNVRAPYALTQVLLPLIAKRQGQIVFINSSAGLSSRASVGAYAASKHALKAIADALRAEVNAAGVRVITVYPGRTATPQQQSIHEQEGKRYQSDRLLQPEDVASAVLSALAMPRTAEVTDISIRPMQKA
jgi:NADP-dependent 3-hydroxy acid dehydrogenase YdfG